MVSIDSQSIAAILDAFLNRFDQKYDTKLKIDSSAMATVRNYFSLLKNDNVNGNQYSAAQFDYMLKKLSASDPFRSETFDDEKLSRFNIRMKKVARLLAQSDVDLLKAVTAVYSCFVDFLRRGPHDTESSASTHSNKENRSSFSRTTSTRDKVDEKSYLIDTLMRAAVDEVVSCLPNKDADYDDYYSDAVLIKCLYSDRNKLDSYSRVTYDTIKNVCDQYGIELKQLINHIRHGNRESSVKESDLAISIQNFVDLHGLEATLSNYLQSSEKQELQFTDSEMVIYGRLFELHARKMIDFKQPLPSQVSITTFWIIQPL